MYLRARSDSNDAQRYKESVEVQKEERERAKMYVFLVES